MSTAITTARLKGLRQVNPTLLSILVGLQADVIRSAARPRVALRASAGEMAQGRSDQMSEEQRRREAAVAEIENLRTSAQADRDRIEQVSLAAIDGTVPSDPTERLARLMEMQAAWDRTVRILDGIAVGKIEERVRALAAAAASQGDSTTAAVLRRELPAYLEARGGEDYLELVTRGLNEAEAEKRPEVRQAVAALQDLKRGWYRVDLALTYAVVEAREGNRGTLLPGWAADGSDDILVEYPAVSLAS